MLAVPVWHNNIEKKVGRKFSSGLSDFKVGFDEVAYM
jgi:hypothetical protein